MQIKAKDVKEKDRLLLPGYGVRQVTQIIERPLIKSTWYEFQFGTGLQVICQGDVEVTLADPDFVIQSRLVQVDYPECPRYPVLNARARKAYERSALGGRPDGFRE